MPLDDCDFGTNSTLTKELGLKELKKVCDEEGYKCGVIAEYEDEKDFNEFVTLVEEKLGEKVQRWQFNENGIKRICILCGAGHLTSDIKVAVDEKCDLYLTGEKILYSVEYAQLHKINLVVGSHTFVELFGVRSLVELIVEEFSGLEVVLIEEEHLEADGFC